MGAKHLFLGKWMSRWRWRCWWHRCWWWRRRWRQRWRSSSDLCALKCFRYHGAELFTTVGGKQPGWGYITSKCDARWGEVEKKKTAKRHTLGLPVFSAHMRERRKEGWKKGNWFQYKWKSVVCIYGHFDRHFFVPQNYPEGQHRALAGMSMLISSPLLRRHMREPWFFFFFLPTHSLSSTPVMALSSLKRAFLQR